MAAMVHLVASLDFGITSQYDLWNSSNTVLDDSVNSYRPILDCVIEKKSEIQMGNEEYMKKGASYRFIKDLSMPEKGYYSIGDSIIVDKTKANNPLFYNPNTILTCLYEEDANSRRKSLSFEDSVEHPAKKKTILIPLNTICEKGVHNRRIEEMQEIRTPHPQNISKKKIEKCIRFLRRVLNVNICKEYLEIMKTSKTIKKGNIRFIKYLAHKDLFREYRENIWDRNEASYNLSSVLINRRSSIDVYRLQNLFLFDKSKVKEILETNTIPKRYQISSFYEFKKTIIKENMKISRRINEYEEKCEGFSQNTKSTISTEEMIKEHMEELKGIIDILLNESISIEYTADKPFKLRREAIEGKIAPWNRSLAKYIVKTINEFVQAKNKKEVVNMEEVVNMGQICIDKLKEKATERDNNADRYATKFFYLNNFGKAFRSIEEDVKKLLTAQEKADSLIQTKEKSKMTIYNENMDICKVVVMHLIDLNIFSVGTKESFGNKQIGSILEIIPNKIIGNAPFISTWAIEGANEKASQNIVDIFMLMLSDKPLFFVDDAEISILKGSLKDMLKSIADIMIVKYTEWTNYSALDDFERISTIERENINKYKIPIIVNALYEFGERFIYPKNRRHIYKLSSLNSDKTQTEFFMNRKNIFNIYKILKHIYISYGCIRNLNTYTEIWRNPAILYIKNLPKSRDQNKLPTGYIFYSSKDGKKTYKKKIKITLENLDAFKRAENSFDIDKIDGDSVEVKSVGYTQI